MRRGLVHVLAWLLATGAAVTLSWWGVHTVMTGTAYDPPRALPVTAAGPDTRDVTSASPERSASPTPSRERPVRPTATPAPARTPARTPSPSPSPSPTVTAAPTASGRIKSYDTDGGRAVFDLRPADASLVSATPGTGWSIQVWKTESWIRVEFSRGADRVSVFCTWHDGPPRVEVGTY
ncbi:Secreted protein [Streptomyces hygroscopicus subsp. limoneus]|nr:Secreted protein [Streptomyces hygroscopicus subsp. limoneus]